MNEMGVCKSVGYNPPADSEVFETCNVHAKCEIDLALEGIDEPSAAVNLHCTAYDAGFGDWLLVYFVNDTKVFEGEVYNFDRRSYDAYVNVQNGDIIRLATCGLNQPLPGFLNYSDFSIVQYIPPEPYEGFCDVFGDIQTKFYAVGDKFAQLADLGSSWLAIGGIVDLVFGGLATMSQEIGDEFGSAKEWCIAVTTALKTSLSIENIVDYLNTTFHITDIYAFIQNIDAWLDAKILEKGLLLPDWIPTSLEDLETLIRTVIEQVVSIPENLDDWFDAKIVSFKETILEWVAEGIENILDKVFEKEAEG